MGANNAAAYNTSQNSLRNSFYNDENRRSGMDLNKTSQNFAFATQTLDNRNSSYKYNVSIEDVVKSNMKKPAFGFDFYNPPKVERAYLQARIVQIGKAKLPNFAEIEAKRKSFVPGPPNYNTTLDWSKDNIKGNRGRFLKSPRMTIAQEIIKNKDKGTPSPGQYDSLQWKNHERVIGNFKS